MNLFQNSEAWWSCRQQLRLSVGLALALDAHCACAACAGCQFDLTNNFARDDSFARPKTLYLETDLTLGAGSWWALSSCLQQAVAHVVRCGRQLYSSEQASLRLYQSTLTSSASSGTTHCILNCIVLADAYDRRHCLRVARCWFWFLLGVAMLAFGIIYEALEHLPQLHSHTYICRHLSFKRGQPDCHFRTGYRLML